MKSNSGFQAILVPCVAWLLVGLTACTAHRAPSFSRVPSGFHQAESETGAGSASRYWWNCRFRIAWPPETKPDMAVDLLLAHAVVRPVLRQHADRIALWRFHRRAARDKTGHQFSFLFYTDPGSAAAIFSDIQGSSILAQARQAGLVEKVRIDDPDHPEYPAVNATSDKGWSPEMQRNWPVFIMGVSASWLGLIEDAMQDFPTAAAHPDALLPQYRKAQAGIHSLWRTEAQHAFLHHLSAVFGYQPLRLQTDIRF